MISKHKLRIWIFAVGYSMVFPSAIVLVHKKNLDANPVYVEICYIEPNQTEIEMTWKSTKHSRTFK